MRVREKKALIRRSIIQVVAGRKDYIPKAANADFELSGN